jgi:hypothetical protein
VPSDAPSLLIENICFTGSIWRQKSSSSKGPFYASTGVFPLVMQALLVTLDPLIDRVVLNYKPSAGRGEPGTWVTSQTGKARQTGKKN